MKNFLLVFLFLLSYQNVNSQSEQIKLFFESLINDQEGITGFIHPDALEKAGRFGINYQGNENKFLISYDIDDEIRDKLKNGESLYKLSEEQLNDDYIKVTLKVEENNYSKSFFFYKDKMASPSDYFTRNWKQKESKYFRFLLSDPELFNEYSIQQLDNFVEVMLDLLNVSSAERNLIETEKIFYILCKNNNEIASVSGFNTRGIYILAYDEIITTFNCHFHEIAHLLINFKLKSVQGVPLYTLPFLQEGFATAVGGRGGLGRNVLLDIGYYLEKSRFIPYNSIITKAEFQSEDASLTYPVAALYNLFLIEELGIESYLELYLNYSGNAEYVANLKLDSIKFSALNKFHLYQENYKQQGGIELEVKEKFKTIFETKAGTILESENFYEVKMRSNLLLKTANALSNYKSNPAKSGSPLRSEKFEEVFPGVEYGGDKYLIKADSREVNIYNLYTNILITSYSAGFSFDNKEIPNEDGYFIFYVRKEVFDEDLEELIVSDI